MCPASTVTTEQLLDLLMHQGVLPAVSIADVSTAERFASSLKSSSVKVMEILFRNPHAPAIVEAFRCDEQLCVGAGTIHTIEQANVAIAAGAQFIVTPGLDEALVGHCLRLNVPVVPGIATATELQMAFNAGLKLVKFFPAEPLGGTKALAALQAAFESMLFMPTGGINLANMSAYLSLPSVVAVGGSWMTPQDLLLRQDFERMCDLISQAMETARLAGHHPAPDPSRGRSW